MLNWNLKVVLNVQNWERKCEVNIVWERLELDV